MHLSNYNLFSFLLAGMGVGISDLFGALESGFLTRSRSFGRERRIKRCVVEVRKRVEEFASVWLSAAGVRCRDVVL